MANLRQCGRKCQPSGGHYVCRGCGLVEVAWVVKYTSRCREHFQDQGWEVEERLSWDMIRISEGEVMYEGSMNCEDTAPGIKETEPSESLPLPPLGENPHVSKEAYEEVQSISQKFTQKHIQKVRNAVKRMYEESSPEGMRNASPKGMPVEYWNEHC